MDLENMSLKDLKKEARRLRDIFEENGGRGVELADEIDEIEAEIEIREHPPSLKDSQEILVKLAQAYLDENGIPEDESIADTELLREVYIREAMKKVRKHLNWTF